MIFEPLKSELFKVAFPGVEIAKNHEIQPTDQLS